MTSQNLELAFRRLSDEEDDDGSLGVEEENETDLGDEEEDEGVEV